MQCNMKEEICDLGKLKEETPEDKKDNTVHNHHAVMLFEPTEGGFVHTADLYFDDGETALWAYAEIPCPASQLVSAPSADELQHEMDKMIKNFGDKEWLEH